MEQKRVGPFKSELDLPACSANQAVAMVNIRKAGGSYVRSAKGQWLPPGGGLSAAARKEHRATDRTIFSLIRSGYLQVAQDLNGMAVRVTLAFP